MADTMNQQIADALTERQLQVGRVEAHLRREAWDQLRLLEAEILAALKVADPTQWALLTRRRREVEQLMRDEIDPLIVLRYERLAALMDEAMMRLATQEVAVVQQVVQDTTGDTTLEALPSERQLRAGVVHGLFPSTAKPTDLSTTGSDWWVRQGASLSQRIGDSLTMGVALEENLTQLTQRVRGTSEQGFQDGVMAKARSDAARLVATHMANTVTEARAAVAARHAEQMVLLHVSRRDTRTSLICIARDGKRFTADTHEPLGHTLPYLSGVPYHPNCVIGSTRVFATGIQGTSQREYIGEVMTLRTHRGYELTCTPNHPVLTNQGWVTAHALDIGSNILCCALEKRAVHFVDMHGNDRPPCIEDIVQACGKTVCMSSVPVPVTAEDFHGDGEGSKIAIIGTNGLLGDGRNAECVQPLVDLCLLGLHMSFRLQCQGFPHQRFHRYFPSTSSSVSRGNMPLTLLRGHPTPFLTLLLTLCAQRDVVFDQAEFNGLISDVIPSAKLLKRQPGPIGRNNVSVRQDFASRHHRDTHFFESLEQYPSADAIRACHTGDGLPGKIVSDYVIHRQVHRFKGHVYNLQTVNGWYISNNIITHNCRSDIVPILADGGSVAQESMTAWLTRRGSAVQDTVLGPTRGRMFREGKLSLRDLLAPNGTPLTLEELGA